MTVPPSVPLWQGRYKIPWDDPAFSRRMLAEHLTQDHDLASRRTAVIEAQVRWIHEHACAGKPCRILDLACGPGLYSARLAGLGHQCLGIDFGPASIAYAQAHAEPGCEFVLGDLRTADFGTGHEVALFIYGEFNVFPPDEIRAILAKTRAALVPAGRLLIEMQTVETVRKSGQAAPIEYQSPAGLFSDTPHRVQIDHAWYEEQATAQQVFRVTDEGTGQVTVYHNTSRAWTEEESRALLADAGFAATEFAADWPVPGSGLRLLLAR